jgi:hypothetical protein
MYIVNEKKGVILTCNYLSDSLRQIATIINALPIIIAMKPETNPTIIIRLIEQSANVVKSVLFSHRFLASTDKSTNRYGF